MLYRNGLRFKNELDYNDWAVNETDLLIMNTEHYYREALYKLDNNKGINGLIFRVMIDHRIKVKSKNIKEVRGLIIEYYKELKQGDQK